MDLISRITFLGSAGASAAGPSEYWIHSLQSDDTTLSAGPNAKAVVSDSSGNVYIAGSLRKADDSGSVGHFVKFGEEGALLLRKEDDQKAIESMSINGSDIYFYNTSGGYGKTSTSLSSVTWFKTESGLVEKSIVADSSSNVYTAGRAQPGTIDGSSRDFYLHKHNSSGTNQWKRHFGNSGVNFFGEGCALLGDGTILVAGGSDVSSSRALYMVRYNSSGSKQTSKVMTRSGTSVFGAAGGMAGFSSSGFVIKSNVSGEAPIITAHDADGDLSWARKVGTSSSLNIGGVCVDSSDNVIAAFDDRTSTDRTLVIVKFNSSGTVQWQRTIEHEGSNGYLIANDGNDCVAVDKDDDIILAANTTTTSPNVAYGVYAIKLPKDGPTAGTYGDYKIVDSSISITDVASSYTVSDVSGTVSTPSTSTPSSTSVTLSNHTRLTSVDEETIS